MIKKLMILGLVSVVGFLSIYLIAVYLNNRDVEYPQTTQLQTQLEKSVKWLVSHDTDALQQANPMLWWMLFETNKIKPDARIADLLARYFARYPRIQQSVWAPLFAGRQQRYLGAYAVEGLPYYNQHFIYALNCASAVAEDLPQVAEQNDPAFCHQSAYFYRPACITHQLMGINFLFTQQCNVLPDIDRVSQSLQQDIVSQLTWDIRVVDVYLQRVLMLLITGAESSIKPIWIHQVLNHQLEDGGWGDFVSLIGADSGQSLGFSSRIVSLGYEKSSFHATAQGIYILSYLLSDNPEGIPE